jgi:hypothetical protein
MKAKCAGSGQLAPGAFSFLGVTEKTVNFVLCFLAAAKDEENVAEKDHPGHYEGG